MRHSTFPRGVFPEKPVEDIKTFLEYITPKRFMLMDALHRHYKNVHDDVKALENIGLVEKDENGRYFVPWEEITASTRLAA